MLAESGTENAAISVADLSVEYLTASGEKIVALDNVSLEIPSHQFLAIVGPSGCGKTTLLRILGGLLKQSRGAALLRGMPIEGPSSDIGIVFQTPVLLPWRTVAENIMLPAIVLRLDFKRSQERALQLIEMVGLGGFANKYPKELSGGMQQRVSIARALLHEPSLLLMDEPFGALDALTRETMNMELQRIAKAAKTTVLFITHSIQEAVFLGDRVVVMTPRPGKVAQIFEIALPRPRDLDMMVTDPFGRYVNLIRHLLNARGHSV